MARSVSKASDERSSTAAIEFFLFGALVAVVVASVIGAVGAAL